MPKLCGCARASVCGCILTFPCVLSQRCYCIDRSPEYFSYVLDYLRGHAIELPDDVRQLRQMWGEADFYLLDGLKRLLNRHGYMPGELFENSAEEGQLAEALENVFFFIFKRQPSACELLSIGGTVSVTITAAFEKVSGECLQRSPACRMTDAIQLVVIMSKDRLFVSSKQVPPSLFMYVRVYACIEPAATCGVTVLVLGQELMA